MGLCEVAVAGTQAAAGWADLVVVAHVIADRLAKYCDVRGDIALAGEPLQRLGQTITGTRR